MFHHEKRSIILPQKLVGVNMSEWADNHTSVMLFSLSANLPLGDAWDGNDYNGMRKSITTVCNGLRKSTITTVCENQWKIHPSLIITSNLISIYFYHCMTCFNFLPPILFCQHSAKSKIINEQETLQYIIILICYKNKNITLKWDNKSHFILCRVNTRRNPPVALKQNIPKWLVRREHPTGKVIKFMAA